MFCSVSMDQRAGGIVKYFQHYKVMNHFILQLNKKQLLIKQFVLIALQVQQTMNNVLYKVNA